MALLNTKFARLNPAHSAVLVVDMQHDFCAEDGYVEVVVGSSTAACRSLVNPLATFLDSARASSVAVVWIRAIYDHDKLPQAILTKHQSNGDVVCCGSGTAGAAFYGVAPQDDEVVFDKHSYSAFTNPDLVGWLRTRGIQSLIFTGVQTNVCVESSLRDAVCRNFYATIASDCVASHSPLLHDATLANVRALFGDVLMAKEIESIWIHTQKTEEATK